MNVVICDDNDYFINELKKILAPVFAKEYPTASIFSFKDGYELFAWYIQKEATIDILYLDVEMPGYSGIDIIKKLRSQGCQCFVIFISSYIVYVTDTLDYDITHYLLKPIVKDKVENITKKVIFQYKMKYHTLRLNYMDEHYILTVNRIISIESNSRKLYFHTLDNDYIIWGKISDIEKELLPFGFLRTHKSYLINMSKVVSYSGYKFYLVNGYSAEIGRTKRSFIISEYEEYLKNQLLH